MSMDFGKIEEKWQERWEKAHLFEANPDSRPKYYLTVAYPYPNAPQHIGHARTYTLADVHARYMRMKGNNTLLPMAFHYTGTPILAMSKRVVSGDEELINIMKDLYGVPAEVLKMFNDPVNIARFFHRDLKLGMKEMGYSIDWRREFTTIDPTYSKFIEWQFHRLSSKGLITKGAHPIGWCPSCRNPVGQHDTLHDVEPEIDEFTAIKFDLDGVSIPTATLRPETIFGVTNIWVNPEAKYVEIEVKGERMIVGSRGAEKLRGQMAEVSMIRELSGSELIGKYVTNPVNCKKIPVLPAGFVDPDNATGIVMSVPAHAPYDLLALKDLKNNSGELSKYGIADAVSSVVPVPVVTMRPSSQSESTSSPPDSEIPAQEVVNRLKVKDQFDPKAEEATKELYQKEFHTARMRPDTGRYAGMPVSKAKDIVKKDLVSAGKAFPFYEIINGPVYCRCGSEVIVNLLSDQWFINYGDESWKEVVRGYLKEMSLVPEELRQEFINVVEWLKEKACARRSGLGTPLPWDKDWIIESLSDSTIYMAYYTISRVIHEKCVDASLLDDAAFNYIFLGEGDPAALKINSSTAEEMRKEFLYFYPLDSRHSGRDLVPNHLTFFIFNHLAIFPRALWPKQIAVNGSVLMDGKKMSKSMGNIIPLRKAITIYGADTLRVSILSASELLQDADFSDSLARSVRSKLQEFFCFSTQYAGAEMLDSYKGSLEAIDRWLLSRVQNAISQATCSMECLRAREAIQTAFYSLQQDILWYLRRSEESGAKARSIIKYVVETIIKIMAPFAPHMCEELWEAFGHEGFVSAAAWPEVNSSLIDISAEVSEDFLKGAVGDTAEIVKVTGLAPTKIFYYVSPSWKWDIYLKLLSLLDQGSDPKALIRDAMKDPAVRARGAESAKFISSISQCAVSMSKDQRTKLLSSERLDELACLKTASQFLSRYFKCQVEAYSSESPAYDPKGRAGSSSPLRPAIYVEGSPCSE